MKQAIKFMALMLVAMLLFASCSAPEAQVPEKTSPNNVSDIVNVTFQNLEAKTTAVSSGTVNNVDIASVFFQYKAKNLSGLKQGETTVWTNLTGEGIPGLGQTIKLGRGLWALSLRGFATEEARTTAGTKETEETTAIFAGTIDEFSAGNGSSVLTAHADVPLIFTNAAGTGTLKITVNFTEAYAAVENKKVQVNLVVGDTYNETQTLTFGENGAETSAVATFENVANGIATITVDYLDSDGTPFGDSGVANTLIMTDMTTETSATISMDVVKLIVKGNKPTGAPEDYFVPKVFNSIFDIYPDNIYDNAIVVGYKETTKALDASAITYPYVVYKPVEQDENGRYTASSLGLTPIYGLSVDATEAWWGKTAALGGYGTNTKYSLKTVRIVDEATSIKKQAFWLCSKLETVIIPDSVTEIGETAFNGCSNLASITIPDGVITIGKEAFSGCRSLTDIVIPDSVTSIGFSAFEYCSNLTNVTIGKGLKTIGFQLFYQCTGLENISIPNSVESIDYEAFYNCKNLKNIVIPESVTSIGTRAFATGATTQVNVTYTGTLDQWYALGYGFGSTTDITCKNGEKAILRVYKNSDGTYGVNDLTPYGKTLTEITIPEGIASFGFLENNILTSITIPTSVKSIGNPSYCKNISEVTYLGDVEQWYKVGCYFNDDIDITCQDGKAIYKISKGSNGGVLQYYCQGLTPYGKTQAAATTEMIIPDCVTIIGSSAFNGCNYLTSITLPDGLTSIGEDAFYGCSGLTSISIPDGVTSIGYRAFLGCSNLTSITIPDSVTSIDSLVFSSCSNLASVTIGSGLTSISNYAFSYCSNLTTITIPSSITKVVGTAFTHCDNIKEVNYLGTLDQWYALGYGFGSTTDITCKNGEKVILRVYKNSDGTYGVSDLTPYGKTLTEITIPENFTKFNAYSFKDYTNITDVYVDAGNSNLKIQNGILMSADGTKVIWYPVGKKEASITIPDGVTYIGDNAFQNYSSLTSITIPDGVTEIGTSAFNNCTSLMSITIPDGVTEIGTSAFNNCTSLMSITIPDSVTSIGNDMFNGCSSLTSATIGNGVTSIGNYAFRECSSLASVTIPDSVTSIGMLVFRDCTNLASVTIGNSVTSIPEQAFYGCRSLTDIIIPDSVTSIDKNAFDGCSSLTSVTIGSGVASIGSSAFSYCSQLKDIYVNKDEDSSLFARASVPSGCKIHWNSTGPKSV